MKKQIFAALLCSFLFTIPASAEIADHRGPVRDKVRILGGIGGGSGSGGGQESADSDVGTPGSKDGAGDPGAGGGGGGGVPAAGGGGQDGVAGGLADALGDIFGGPDTGRGNVYHGAPGPVAGAGLPFLGVAYGVYWLIRRRRKMN